MTQPTGMPPRKNVTIVLVHGAWCDASVWTNTLLPLAHEGYTVRAAQLPLQSFAGDVAALTNLLDHVDGPILLAGHSYAGALISAVGHHEKVKALAYICAFAPEANEVFGSLMAMNPAAVQMNLEPDPQGFLWLTAPFAADALGHDLHRGIIHLAIATQKPTSASLFGEQLSAEPAWKSKPSSYLITTDDRILAPATQHTLAQRINARVEQVAASHLVPLSQPEAVANFLRTSAESLL